MEVKLEKRIAKISMRPYLWWQKLTYFPTVFFRSFSHSERFTMLVFFIFFLLHNYINNGYEYKTPSK